jgi:hypothetical protein
MADTKISDLAAVTGLIGTDEFVLARSGDTKKIDATDLAASIGGGGLVVIHDETLTGTQATFDATSIAGTYKHLLIVMSLVPLSVASADVHLTFNGDTGSNYDWGTGYLTGAIGGANTATSDTKIKMDNANNSQRYLLRAEVFDYADATIHKYVMGTASRIASSMHPFSARWKSDSAITQVTLSLSTNSFQSGSRCRIYGMS